MKLHRILAVATTLALGATLFTATGAMAVTSGDFTFSTTGGNATITGYDSNGPLAVVIPNSVSDGTTDYPVTAIGAFAFAGDPDGRQITSVIIPSTVTSIGLMAFNSNALTSVTIPAGVTSIGESAFSYNMLASVVIPSGITLLDKFVFLGNRLASVTIPAGVTSIGRMAFDVQIDWDTGVRTLQTILFLGSAPTVIPVGTYNSFDTENADFSVSYASGSTGFGDGPTWQGYALTQPSEPPVTSPSDVTAGVTAGARSATLDRAVFGLVPFSHSEQSIETTAGISADDLTGAGVGWNVTLSSTDLTWTAANGGPTTGTDLPASALAVTTVGRITTVAGENWNGETALGSLDSPVKVLSTPGGNGSYTAPLTLTLTVPGQASVGTYAGTLTTTISAAP
jgi:hypothetical protein